MKRIISIIQSSKLVSNNKIINLDETNNIISPCDGTIAGFEEVSPIQEITDEEKIIILSKFIGPAGTGKTFLPVAVAVNHFIFWRGKKNYFIKTSCRSWRKPWVFTW